jgi:hypothetical protein
MIASLSIANLRVKVMETQDRKLLDSWIESWSDLVDFEVQQVITSAEAASAVSLRDS